MYKKFRIAFTLAEVILTLTIVGIIACETIPSLLNNVQDAQLKIAWKRAYGALDQTTRMLMADNALSSLKGICNGSEGCLVNLYKKYLATTKTCYVGEIAGNCWHLNNAFYYMNGSPVIQWDEGGFIFNNGNLLYIGLNGPATCTTDPYGSLYECGQLIVDVNGFKGPNKIGKDIYFMHIVQEGLKPYGVQGDGEQGTCNSSNSGLGCAALYLLQ